MNSFIIIFIIVLIIITLLKLYNLRCCKIAKELNPINMMKKKPSYKKFIEISNLCSPPNRPKRQSGDFLDYFIEGISKEDQLLENNLMNIYGVGENE